VQFEQVIRLDPERHRAYDFMAQIYMAQEQEQQARQFLLRALAAHPNAGALMARLGILLLDAGEFIQASEYLEKAIRKDPDNAEAYYGLGQAHLRSGQSARGNTVLHYFELLQSNYKILLDLKTAMVLNPSDAMACFALGKVYGRIERYEAARQAYLAVLKIDPDHIDAQNNLGNIYLRQQRPHRAIEVFSVLLQADSTYVRAYNNLGYAYLATNQPQRAIATYEKAIAVDASYAQAHSSLGTLYMKQGRIPEAEEHRAIYEKLTR
jgi:tetratricopeptide (TPR) repeat protein